MRLRRCAAGAALAASLVGLTAMASATAATANEARPGLSPTNVTVMNEYDFRVEGVRIFRDPTGGAPVNGLGYQNQYMDLHRWAYGQPYACDNGVTSTLWGEITNRATGVRGWVPECNITVLHPWP